MKIYHQLLELEQNGCPIRIGIIGAGQMGYGLCAQISKVPGMTVTGIASLHIENAQKAKDVVLSGLSETHSIMISTDFRAIVHSSDVDIIVDATGIPEVGAKIALETLLAKKSLVLLNVEVDITIGTLLYNLFSSAGLIYTGSDGDEPASTFELVNFARTLGFEVLAAGKGKNNRVRLDANPSSVADEASRRGMSAHMLASFADGTKTMAEMTLLSNATGLRADITGMHGTKGDLKATLAQLRLVNEGGVLNNYGIVEYVDGLAPGVFVIVKGHHEGVVHQLNYMMQTDNDHHIIYRPYHLGSLETPISIAKAFLNHEASIVPLYGPVSDTVCVAKKDISAGERLDGIGGYCLRGVIESHTTCLQRKLVPIGLIAGDVYAKRDILNGTFITENDIQLDSSTTIWKLRKLQDEIIG